MTDPPNPPQVGSPTPRTRRGLGTFFLRGIVTLAPVVLTVVAFGLLYQMVDRYVTGPINSVIYWSLETNSLGWRALRKMEIEPLDIAYLEPNLLPVEMQDQALSFAKRYSDPQFRVELKRYRDSIGDYIYDLDDLAISGDRLRADVKGRVPPWIGIALSLLLVLWLGWVVGGFLGRRLVQRMDRTMHMIPIVKSVYPYSKQLVEFFFAEKKLEFDTVVAIPYPSPHVMALAFITGNSLKSLRSLTGQQLVSCFVPSSPMPMTGYTIFIERRLIMPLAITVDEALRITMSGGVLVPTRELVEGSLEGEFQAHLAQRQAQHDAEEVEAKTKKARRRSKMRKRKPGDDDADPLESAEGDERNEANDTPDDDDVEQLQRESPKRTPDA